MPDGVIKLKSKKPLDGHGTDPSKTPLLMGCLKNVIRKDKQEILKNPEWIAIIHYRTEEESGFLTIKFSDQR